MHIQIEANKEELLIKKVSLVKSIAEYIGEVDPELKNRLIKAIDDKDKLFTNPVLLEVLKQWELGYKDQTEAMLSDINRILNKGKLNKSIGSSESWIGVDLDGTLAEYHGYKGPASIGDPIPRMVDRVKEWIGENKNVKIMTARANPNSSDFRASISAIRKWCKQYIGQELPVVYEKDLHMEELWDDRAIQIKPNTVLSADGLNKGIDDGVSYFHYDVATDSYVEDYNDALMKAQRGPFIGPRGGKWADPEHTIPWKEEEHGYNDKGERYSDEEADGKLDAIGDRLYHHQAINPHEVDDTGFNRIDMEIWRSVSGLNAKRQLLHKYKRQIIGGYGIEEYYKLGLNDTREGKGFKADIKPYYNKTWGSLTLPVDGRVDRETFNKFREINRKHNVWFSNGENFVKEQYLNDFDFGAYQKDMGEIGIKVHPIKGERKQKLSEKEDKDLTPDEALQQIRNRTIKDAIVLKKIGKDKFAFWSTYSPEFNDLFSNKTGGLSGIFYANKDNAWARETHELNLVEEALHQIKKQLPNYKLYIDEEGLKEAQNERARYQAELQKPIPEVQKLLDSKYALFPYQNEAVHFLDKTDGNALIGDSMGLGKTLETLAWLAKGNKKTILVVPKVVRRTWLQEADKFFPGVFNGTELVSADIRNNRVPNLNDKNIVTVNYESLGKFYPYLKDAGFDTVVVDESHRMKNPKAKQTKAIQKVAALTKHHILLSGTAVKNKKEELFTQLEVVAPGKFTSKNQIKFATIGGLWRDMKDFYIARSKEEVLKDLPEKTTSIIQQDIPNLPDYGADKDIGDIARIKAAVAIGKVPATIDLAKEILNSSDSKIIVFTDSVEAAKKINEELGDVSLLHHGQMSDDKREAVKEEFQRVDGNGDFISTKRVFVTTRQSMAVGATLTAADKVIFNDLPWTAADLRQAEDRAHRIGQKNNVNVYWVTASNNLFDSSVTEIIKRKYELSKKINQGKKLTKEEIDWMNKPLTISDILNKIHGGKTPIEEEKGLPISESKPEVPVIPIEAPKQEQKPMVSVVRSVIPDSQLSDKELIQRIKSYGKDRHFSYALFDRSRNLESKLSMQEFYDLWDRVDPKAFSEYREIKFKPTHTGINSVEPVMVIQRTPSTVSYINSIGEFNKDNTFDFDIRYKAVEKEKPRLIIREPVKKPVIDDVSKDIVDIKRDINETRKKIEKLRERQLKDWQSGDITRKRTTTYNAQISQHNDRIQELKNILNKYDEKNKEEQGVIKIKPEKIEVQEPVKRKRGRPPGSKNIVRTAIKETPSPFERVDSPALTIQEPEKKKRGRPPGSKNIVRTAIKETPPTFKREAIPSTTNEISKRGRPPKSQSVKDAESSLSYVSAKNIKLKKVDSDPIHDIYQTNFSIDEDDAKIAMKNLREQGINVTILEGDPGIIKIRKGFTLDMSDLQKALFIGPQGGRWANAEHTIPYKEEKENKPIKRDPPGSQLPQGVQDKLKELKVDKLPQSIIPVSEIRTDFSGDINSKAIITWKDVRGKIQSGYTPKFHEMNAKKKWDRIHKFRNKKKGIVFALNEKLIKGSPGSIEHQGHTILAIIAETGLRPGSIESVQKHGHYGISTLQREHVSINDKMVVLNFIGKEGKENITVVQNPVTVKVLKHYIDNTKEGSGLFNPGSLDKVKYILPKGMKVKDLRTIKATESAERLLKQVEEPPPLTGDVKKDKRLLAKALFDTSKKVATILNNTPAIAKASYIHPMVFEQWAKSVGANENLWKGVM
jgi:SWI/SNF-related matrix-associated actin-dependent regulator 1 of chromatin subfamily A